MYQERFTSRFVKLEKSASKQTHLISNGINFSFLRVISLPGDMILKLDAIYVEFWLTTNFGSKYQNACLL